MNIKANFSTKWQPRTRGGYAFEIFAEREGELYGLAVLDVGRCPMSWFADGSYMKSKSPTEYDLLPINSTHEAEKP